MTELLSSRAPAPTPSSGVQDQPSAQPDDDSAADEVVELSSSTVPAYTPGNPEVVAELIECFTAEFLFETDERLDEIVAHCSLQLDTARFDAEIEQPTEWLDLVLAQQIAAVTLLARRAGYGYSIQRQRPGTFTREFLDELKRRVSISDLLRGYGAQLFRRGRGFVAHCPFPDHDDRYPSFYVYDDTNSCWCFGCQRGGDVIELVELMEALSFPDAVRKLAADAGVSLPQPRRVVRGGEV